MLLLLLLELELNSGMSVVLCMLEETRSITVEDGKDDVVLLAVKLSTSALLRMLEELGLIIAEDDKEENELLVLALGVSVLLRMLEKSEMSIVDDERDENVLLAALIENKLVVAIDAEDADVVTQLLPLGWHTEASSAENDDKRTSAFVGGSLPIG